MPTDEVILSVRFESEEAFRREYNRSMATGGVFIPKAGPLEPDRRVEVHINLCYAQASYAFSGRIVSCIPPELADAGATPGAVVQLDASVEELRAELGPHVSAARDEELEDERITQSGRRQARRWRAGIPIHLRGAHGEQWEGRTRNLSRGGALISLPERPGSVGEKVWLRLANPATGAEREFESRIVREVVGEDGSVVALGVVFQPGPSEALELTRFMEEVAAAEQTRRRGGISGPVSPVGLGGLLQGFSQASPVGTMTVVRGTEEGFIAFENEQLLAARLGRATGRKALTRMLAWEDASFEFHAFADAGLDRDQAQPLLAVLLDAMRLVDESRRAEAPRFAPDSTVQTDSSAAPLAAAKLGQLEATIADLAAEGMVVREILERIPQPDFEVAQALARLAKEGVVTLSP